MNGLKLDVDLLDEDNYGLWASDMESVLTIADCWDAVVKAKAAPAKDAKALAYIRMYIKKKLRPLVQECKTPKAAWDTLAQQFQSTGFSTLVELMGNLLTLKLGESEGMGEYHARVEALKQKFESAKEPLSETLIALAALHGLPDDYAVHKVVLSRGERTLVKQITKKTVVTGEGDAAEEVEEEVISTVEKTTLKLSDMFAALRQAELTVRDSREREYGISDQRALAAQHSQASAAPNRLTHEEKMRRLRLRLCFTCGKPGHQSGSSLCEGPRQPPVHGAMLAHTGTTVQPDGSEVPYSVWHTFENDADVREFDVRDCVKRV